jgi:hypothetical protein
VGDQMVGQMEREGPGEGHGGQRVESGGKE